VVKPSVGPKKAGTRVFKPENVTQTDGKVKGGDEDESLWGDNRRKGKTRVRTEEARERDGGGEGCTRETRYKGPRLK